MAPTLGAHNFSCLRWVDYFASRRWVDYFSSRRWVASLRWVGLRRNLGFGRAKGGGGLGPKAPTLRWVDYFVMRPRWVAKGYPPLLGFKI